MDRLDIFGVVIFARSSHTFGLDVVGHNLVVIREGFAADCTFPALLDDFSVEQLPHFCR